MSNATAILENTSEHTGLPLILKELRLPSVSRMYYEISKRAQDEGWSYVRYLSHLSEIELEEREQRRRERLLKQSGLSREKTLSFLDTSWFDARIKHTIAELCEGDFIKRAENVLVFGLPGRGKTHVVSAIAHELIDKDYKVLFTPTYKLVQRLLIAKKNLALESELRKLDRFDVVILDDIGYIQQERDEMEVLFTFLGERYERKPVMITSNLVFSQWDQIFKDPMTTAAAIDRVVHHSVILEINSEESYRVNYANKRKEERGK